MKSFFLWLGTALLCAAGAAAQPSVLTLQQCIRLAQDSQYSIRNARLEEAQYDAARREAARAFLPALGLEAGYELTGTTGNSTALATGLAAQVLLFQGGYLRRQLAYRASVQQYAAAQVRRAGSGVKWTVTELYLKALLARDNRAAGQHVLQQLARYAQQPGTDLPYAVEKYARNAGLLQAQYQADYQQLMTFIYRPEHSNDSLIDPGRTIPVFAGHPDAALQNGLLTDAGLLEDRRYLDAAGALIAYRQRAALPSLSLRGYYGTAWEGPANAGFPTADRNGYLVLRAGVPLFNTGTVRKDIAQARLLRQQAAARLAENERLLHRLLYRYFEQHRLYTTTLLQADKALAEAEHGFATVERCPELARDVVWAADQLYDALLSRNQAWYQLCYQTLWIDFNSGKL